MRICLYGASSDAIPVIYLEKTQALGEEMARRGHTLVFGGGAQGLMGAAARGAEKGGGQIIGVAPTFFQVDGVLFERCSQMIPTKTMRERKQIMEDQAEAFIMTPGGIGTYEEFFEILTLKQLGRHNKAIGVYNISGYFDPMMAMLEQAIEQGFMKPACRELFASFEDAQALLTYLEKYRAESVDVRHMKNI